jgi:hypothetical protein
MTRTATLTFGDQTIELPVIEGSEGELAVDITQLRAKSGLITLDAGFGNTGACRSAITFIDGDRGILRHRGISIEQLAESSTFVEVAWLLIFGRLPSQTSSTASASGWPPTRRCTRRSGTTSRASPSTPRRWPCSRPWSTPSPASRRSTPEMSEDEVIERRPA